MKFKEKKLQRLLERINEIIDTAEAMEEKFTQDLEKVHPAYKRSALNLIHYMALRSHYIADLQEELRMMGLPGLSNVEGHVMRSLLAIKTILNHLSGNPKYEHRKGTVSIKKSSKVLNSNTRALFGAKRKKRRTRIMVTLPNTAAGDAGFVEELIALGMNSARINCAHDTPEVWEQMISNVRQGGIKKHKQVKVMMDLGGPKLRTGKMTPGEQVIHIKPDKDVLGNISSPAKVWLAPADQLPPFDEKYTHIPLELEQLSFIKSGNTIEFKDSRGKNCTIEVMEKADNGRVGICKTSAYIIPGTEFNVLKHKESGDKTLDIGELQPLEQTIFLKTGDKLTLTSEPIPGEPAKYDEDGNLLAEAHISCTLPEIFNDVKVGEPIMFDDGKIEGEIVEVSPDEIRVRIIHTKEPGSKLKSDKGINLPVSELSTKGLTEKDKGDIPFIAKHADTVNFSFVNTPEDVQELLDLLDSLNANIGIILKIETRKGFNNLPQILLTGMQNYPLGVMIARGDLAVEAGWNNVATIQEEILRICEAAQIPDVWATQVLETLAKKGTPSRAEITDAAASQRAECVMLNKGPHIKKAIRLLDKIIRKMQSYQNRREVMLSQLDKAEEMSLVQDYD